MNCRLCDGPLNQTTKRAIKFTRCDACMEKYKRGEVLIARWFNRLVKQEVLKEYGNKCVCCGEADPIVLDFDHIEGDGANFRKENSSCRNQAVYIRRQGCPKDKYQILCRNCNWAKYRNGNKIASSRQPVQFTMKTLAEVANAS